MSHATQFWKCRDCGIALEMGEPMGVSIVWPARLRRLLERAAEQSNVQAPEGWTIGISSSVLVLSQKNVVE